MLPLNVHLILEQLRSTNGQPREAERGLEILINNRTPSGNPGFDPAFRSSVP